MRSFRFILPAVFLLFIAFSQLSAQSRYSTEFKEFAIDDSLHSNKSVKILFAGSSTFRKWNNMKKDLAREDILNRGFGGSTMKELYQFRERLISKYHPSQVFIYEGDNDIAQGTPVDTIMKYTKMLLNDLAEKSKCRYYFISVKPSPSRTKFLEQQKDLNEKFKSLAKERASVYYIDIFKLFYIEGNIPDKYFEADKLHLNSEGYKLLSKEIIPYLAK